MEELYNIANRMLSLNNSNLLLTTLSQNPKLKKMVIQLNTAIQLRSQHIDSKGNALYSKKHQSSTYSKTTEIISKGRKIAGTPYTLFDTGEFFKSFEIILDEDGFEIKADPIKKGDSFGGTNLFEEYGLDILGLTDKNMVIFIDALLIQIYDVILTILTKQN